MESTRTTVNEWIVAIGKSQGHELALDEDGHVCLACGDGTKVLIEVPANSELFFFYTPLMRLPDDLQAQNAALKNALALNNFSLETGGASFGYDARTSSLLLTFAERVEGMDVDVFAECLGRFIELALDMKSRVATDATAPAVDTSVPGGMAPMLRV